MGYRALFKAALLVALVLASSANHCKAFPIASETEQFFHDALRELDEELADSPLDHSRANNVRETKFGSVEGVTRWGVQRYLGVPFAKPPVGDLRFAAPQNPDSWSGVLETKDIPRACVQTGPLGLYESEDCLYLNVWTPRDASPGKTNYAVMVWIHGGGYNSGSGSIYLPAKMMKRVKESVIVVTVNYRLNALGFLSLNGTADDDLNVGLLDQQLALKWVRENIDAFGGDPLRVTIFGESAGGSSVSMHMVMKSSAPYFRGAIMESPGPATLWSLDEGADASRTYASSLGCDDVACLRALPASKLKRGKKFDLLPVVGFATVPDQPVRMLSRGEANEKSFIMGVNAAEGDFFVRAAAGDPPMSDAAYQFWMEAVFLGKPSLRRFAKELYEPVRQQYGNWRAISQACADYFITCGAELSLNASLTLQSNQYSYVFTQRSPYAFQNVTHVSELPYVFARYQKFTDVDEVAVDRIVTYWINFAVSGNPNEPMAADFPWRPYEPASSQPTVMDLRGDGAHPYLMPFESRFCRAWAAEYFAQLPPHL